MEATIEAAKELKKAGYPQKLLGYSTESFSETEKDNEVVLCPGVTHLIYHLDELGVDFTITREYSYWVVGIYNFPKGAWEYMHESPNLANALAGLYITIINERQS